MPALAYHLVLRLDDDRVIAPTRIERVVVARSILGLAGPGGLLAFAIVDTHIHILIFCSRGRAGQLSRDLKVSLRRRLGLPVRFVMREPIAIDDAWHVYNSAGYVFRQFERHRLKTDLLCEGSNLQDVLGMRAVYPGARECLSRQLPRLTDAELWSILGPGEPLTAGGPTDRVLRATLSAAALPNLRGKSREVLRARRAALEVLGGRLSVSALSDMFEVDRRALSRARQAPPDPALVRAIHLQLGALRWLLDDGGEAIILRRRGRGRPRGEAPQTGEA